MDRVWRIAVGQINCTVGDLSGNTEKIIRYADRARELGVDVIAFPELAVTGYPPEDLLLKPKFVDDNLAVLRDLAKVVADIVAIVGFVDRRGKDLFNAAAVIWNGAVKGVHHKTLLPNYGVFDEERYFRPGAEARVFRYGSLLFGVNICEDIWFPDGPTQVQAGLGAGLIVNINASPYHAGKVRLREKVVRSQVRANGSAVVYANLVGGQDELVFDGQSLVVDSRGRIAARASAFEEDLLVVDLPRDRLAGRHASGGTIAGGRGRVITVTARPMERPRPPVPGGRKEPLPAVAEVYGALSLGLADYVRKNGFRKVVVGLSGGVDSAIVATLAADSLGSENVAAVFMPSRYTSAASGEDARALAANLGIELRELPVDAVYNAYEETLSPCFRDLPPDITEENIQARIRGNLLMALSNKFGWLVLTTGNKSEMSVGYATLYGDMAGGFAVIKDVPKTLVYDLCRYRNSLDAVIPERILTREPTAELRPDQKDSDSLPVYEVLDPILKAYVEEDKSRDAIAGGGAEPLTVEKVVRLVDGSEYKRRQAPPGIKITPKAFGRDRRMPITNRYRG